MAGGVDAAILLPGIDNNDRSDVAAAAVDVDVEADDGGAAVVDGGIVDAVHWILFYELASPSMPRRAEHGSRLDSIVSVAEHRVRSCFLGRLYRSVQRVFLHHQRPRSVVDVQGACGELFVRIPT